MLKKFIFGRALRGLKYPLVVDPTSEPFWHLKIVRQSKVPQTLIFVLCLLKLNRFRFFALSYGILNKRTIYPENILLVCKG